MANSDVSVRFGADDAELQASIALSTASLKSFQKQTNALAAQMVATGGAADTAMNARLYTLAERAAQAKASLTELQAGAAEAAEGAATLGLGVSEATNGARALIDEISSGRYRQATGTFTRLALTIAAANPALAGATAAALAFGGALAYLAVRGVEAAAAAQKVVSASTFGGFPVLQGQAAALTASFAKMADVSMSVAGEVIGSFVFMQSSSTPLIEALSLEVQAYANFTKQEMPQAADALAKSFEDPTTKGEAFIATLHNITPAELELWEAARKTGSAHQMQAAMLQLLAAAMARQQTLLAETKAKQEAQTAAVATGIVSQGDIKAATDAYSEAMAREVARINETMSKIRDYIAVLGSLKDTTDDVAKAALALSSGSPSAMIAKLTGNIQTLRQALQGATGDAASLIKGFEGFKSQAYWDKNHYRVGYGSDTTTSPTGKVSMVTQGTTTTQEDAERDLARRIQDLTDTMRAQIGPAFDKLSSQAQASLTSVAYNYGKLPSSVVSAAQTGSDTNVAGAIGALSANPERRSIEAANITGLTPEQAAQVGEQLRTDNDLLRQQQELLAGGNAAAVAALDIAQRNASAAQDAVRDAKELVDAKKLDLDATKGGTVTAQLQAQKALADAQASLRQKEVEQSKSQYDLQAAEAVKGSKAELDATIAGLNAQQAQYRQGSAEWNAIQQQKIAATKSYTDQQVAIEKEAEDQKYKTAVNALNERKTLIKQEGDEHQITRQQELAELDAVQNQMTSLEKQHLETLKGLYDQGTTEFTKYQQELLGAEQKGATDRAKTEKQVNQQIYTDTKQRYEQIGSTITGGFLSAVEGQETFKQAASQTALSLVNSFVQARVKLVADWLAGLATQTTGTVASQGTQTAAVVAGQAAQTAATATGGAARIASQAAAVVTGTALERTSTLTTISADAAKAAAGAYAAVAQIPLIGPVLGPIAAGVAYAGVEAFGSFSDGSWGIPRETMALLHPGEIVLPSEPAGGFRSIVDRLGEATIGGATQPGPAGNTTHNHFHGAILDGRKLTKLVRDNMNQDRSLRLAY